MKRSGPPKRRTRLAPRSDKQAARDEVIAAAGEEAKGRDRYRCQAARLVPTVRCGGALDPQHVIPRGVRKDLADLVVNIVAVCRLHHLWIDTNPDAARALGLHGWSTDDPDVLREVLLRALASAR